MTRVKISQQIESLSDAEASQVLDFVKVLREQPENLPEREREEIEAGGSFL